MKKKILVMALMASVLAAAGRLWREKSSRTGRNFFQRGFSRFKNRCADWNYRGQSGK